ncbi:flagellin N-terminal helical domain-containing protein [Granulicella arctica]|uniref:flagellin N-terminal helical domain-containing protein n=1 Tax=Granulicella arctica TaxID=940613 RepID=UPI0021E055E4|nr:flagellar hook-associated protein 3 [Granulicella arctica]
MRVDPNYLTKLSSQLDQSTNVEAQLTAELSSGLRVTSLSTDPVAVAQSTILNSAISQQDTYVQVASGESSRLQATDSALGEVVTQLTSAVTLATAGANSIQNASGQTATLAQLTGIRDSILSLANTSYSGTYLFAGSQGTTKPFSIDTSTVPATTTYAGDAVAQSVVTPTGQSIQVNLPGSAVFTSVLNTLNQLIGDFSGSNVSTAVAADSASVTAALGLVTDQRSVIDNSLSRLQATSTYIQTQTATATIAQSSLVSANPADIATQLSASETQNQALMSVISSLGKTDLFDYTH